DPGARAERRPSRPDDRGRLRRARHRTGSGGRMNRAARMRLLGFMRKEMLQIVRDPSSIALALVMPVVLILLFGYGVSLDAEEVPIAIVLEDRGPAGRDLFRRFDGSQSFAPLHVASLP